MSKGVKVILGTVIAAIVVVVVAIAVMILTRDDAPEAVDLESTVARIEAAETADSNVVEPSAGTTSGDSEDASTAGATTSASEDVGTTSSTDDDTAAVSTDDNAGDDGTADDGTADDGAADARAADTDTGTAAAGQTVATAGLDGVWTVEVADNAGDLQGEPVVSFAGFRVDEVLGSGIGEFTAVGRTAEVSGSIELTDTALVATTVEVAMSTLRTDNGSRDSRVYRALNTSEFPLAVFTLVEPVELPAGMADGETFSGSAQGDLTIKGVTNRVAFDLQAQLVGDRIVVVGSAGVTFSDYDVTAPTAPIVVSVEDHGIMEFQLIFTP